MQLLSCSLDSGSVGGGAGLADPGTQAESRVLVPACPAGCISAGGSDSHAPFPLQGGPSGAYKRAAVSFPTTVRAPQRESETACPRPESAACSPEALAVRVQTGSWKRRAGGECIPLPPAPRRTQNTPRSLFILATAFLGLFEDLSQRSGLAWWVVQAETES